MKNLLQIIGFQPKENATAIFYKKYQDGYVIEIDFEKQTFYFGGKIKIGEKESQNITKPEDWVVLECVNRLLETGYKPSTISLEKVYPSGHGTSGRLDICVNHENGSEYLLIECKTYGTAFDKEFTRIKKDGGQLFTYFKFSNKADVIMLYASQLVDGSIVYKNEIVKIKEDYRKGDVKDFHNSWDKKTYQNIVWENKPYNLEIKKTFTKAQLKPLSKDESDKIFHGFASILRKHSVSDKPNAFNKIFNLFLAKLYDEAKGDDMELEFHWREDDDPVDFQIRLINLHQNGLLAFLEKEIEGIYDKDFVGYKDAEDLKNKKKKLLKFNNVLTIKEVLDDASFDENQRVLKDVVKLLEKYQIRYPRKQQHLSDFFELLLTTGLKQEVGQYFTPPPVTKFIVRSLPIKKMMLQEINNQEPKLPAIIDYAAGSGHFITEALEEYQDIINNIDIDKELTFPKAKSAVQSWVADPYNWAAKYVYGIEKDYRLVKVAKVGCYFYGDGVAQIIHGDGLDSFATSKTYKGLLQENINIEDSSKAKFSVVISNPPYAVNDCKDDLEYIGAQNEYSLYSSLSDKSKDIECLFVERTKHLLKDGGVASLILPSSILNNTGIQTKTREIILQYFDIVAIAELGSNTFMATGTNTVTLFLRRRANKLSAEWRKSVAQLFETKVDITINGIEKPLAKYIKHVWASSPPLEGLGEDDYISMLEKKPNEAIQNHEIYVAYRKKLKKPSSNSSKGGDKEEKDFWNILLDREADKLLYFIIALNQKVVLVKSGEKEAEKRFLGYEFSSRRNSEGMHAMQRDKTVDECTQMYDAKVFDNPEKASTYILKAFTNVDFEIDPKMQNHISQHDLVDMMTFDRVEFEKTISLAVKKKVRFDAIWGTDNLQLLGEIAEIKKGTSITKEKTVKGTIPVIAGGQEPAYFHNEFNRDKKTITVSASGAYAGFINYFETPIFASDCNTIISKQESKISTKLIYLFLKSIQNEIYGLQRGQAQPHVYAEDLSNVKIPLPPLEIQQKIVSEIEVLEAKEKKAKEEVDYFIQTKNEIIKKLFSQNKYTEISHIAKVLGGKRIPKGLSFSPNKTEYPYLRVSDFKKGTIDSSNLKYIEEDVFKQIRNYTISKEDIYISIAGTIGLVGLIPENLDGKSLTENAGKIVIIERDLISKEFLYYCLISENLQKQIEDNTRAVGVPKLALKRIETFKIPLPPLSEQQKIVSEIEKIEEKIKGLETQIAEIPKQKEAVLKKFL